jgi:hypothetical protein
MEVTRFTDFTDQTGGVGEPTQVKGPQSGFYFDGNRLFNHIPSFCCVVRIVFVLSLLLSLTVIIIVTMSIFIVLIFGARVVGNLVIGNVILSGLSSDRNRRWRGKSRPHQRAWRTRGEARDCSAWTGALTPSEL